MSLSVKHSNNNEITGIKADSRKISRGDIFVAIIGEHHDGASFIKDAISKGAAAVLIDKKQYSKDKFHSINTVPILSTSSLSSVMATLANRVYDNPSKKMNVVGITGTNGKTTVCYLLESVFKAIGKNTGVIGTINYRYGNKIVAAPNTTPQSADLQSLLKEMHDNSVSNVFMEVSSHALSLNRVSGVDFDLAVFTNLTGEHLDFHKTMDDYFNAKKSLFTKYLAMNAKNSKKINKCAIINSDDEWGKKLIASITIPHLSYGIHKGSELCAHIAHSDVRGVSLEIEYNKKKYQLHIKLLGEHNVYNVLAALGASIKLGLQPKEAIPGLRKLQSIPGRMERITNKDKYDVIVDYAHTDDALGKALKCIRSLKPARIITVFGCGGNRDTDKRPRMGIIASKLSDWVVVTSDNPRDEDPRLIMNQIEQGIKSINKNNYSLIEDREEAIKCAINNAKCGDIILLAGKGHETCQIIGDKRIDFDDRLIARKYIKKC
ncbi:MAG: UDP-N-acetylmuramoyl-L-alanyl-D-glutamate--2,6-diaminopimelate ligase [bacterium]